MRKTDILAKNLDELREHSPKIQLQDYPRMVIFSDLHVGNGGKRDDFRLNSELVKTLWEKYYFDHALVLNGDIEDMQKFRKNKILNAWKDLYQILWKFQNRNLLFKIIGNHDWALQALLGDDLLPWLPGLRLGWQDKELFVFHGHQASRAYTMFQPLITLGLRFLAVPLGLMNTSAAHDDERKIKLEKQVYHYSRSKGIASIIGHTHRPLFESLSKQDTIKYRLESLLRALHDAPPDQVKEIEREILECKESLNSELSPLEKNSLVYSDVVPVPCLFNSGSCLGDQGITCLEIERDQIYLVHWLDRKGINRYRNYAKNAERKIPGTEIYRVVIKKDSLQYLFNCIQLLR